MSKKLMAGKRIFAIIMLASAVFAADTGIGPYRNLSQVPDVMSVFEIIPQRSKVAYYGKSNAHDFRGITGLVTGRIEGNPSKIEQTAKVEIYARVATFNSGDPKRDKKMRSVVETNAYPVVAFVSTRLEVVSQDGVSDYKLPVRLIGKLTFHGKTIGIIAPVKLGFNPVDYTMSAEGNFSVRISDFDIEIPRLLFFKVEDEIVIKFRVVAKLVSPKPGEIPTN